jgi:four helix bundle protein
MMSISSYRDLVVWQKAMTLAKAMYETTRCYPKDELYGLTSQIRRSAISIPSNIAEGWGRQSTGDYIHFLKIAQGSTTELDTEMILSMEVGFLPEETLDPILNNTSEIRKMLKSLIKTLSSGS